MSRSEVRDKVEHFIPLPLKSVGYRSYKTRKLVLCILPARQYKLLSTPPVVNIRIIKATGKVLRSNSCLQLSSDIGISSSLCVDSLDCLTGSFIDILQSNSSYQVFTLYYFWKCADTVYPKLSKSVNETYCSFFWVLWRVPADHCEPISAVLELVMLVSSVTGSGKANGNFPSLFSSFLGRSWLGV